MPIARRVASFLRSRSPSGWQLSSFGHWLTVPA
jgi:hypothetical protein